MGRPHALLVAVCLGLTTFGQQPVQARIVEQALDLVGVRESPRCNNCGIEVERMLAQVGFPKGYNWCGAAQYHIMCEAGVDLPPPVKKYAWVPSWFPAAKVAWRQGNRSMEGIEAGMQVGLYYPSLRRVAHIGVIVGIEGRWVITVEGNTGALGGRDGGGVEVHRRRIDTIWVISKWY